MKLGSFDPYKLCDFRFAFGDIYRECAEGYDYWGFGDVDVIYGDLREFLQGDLLERDPIIFNASHVSGHFALVKNTEENRPIAIGRIRSGVNASEI